MSHSTAPFGESVSVTRVGARPGLSGCTRPGSATAAGRAGRSRTRPDLATGEVPARAGPGVRGGGPSSSSRRAENSRGLREVLWYCGEFLFAGLEFCVQAGFPWCAVPSGVQCGVARVAGRRPDPFLLGDLLGQRNLHPAHGSGFRAAVPPWTAESVPNPVPGRAPEVPPAHAAHRNLRHDDRCCGRTQAVARRAAHPPHTSRSASPSGKPARRRWTGP